MSCLHECMCRAVSSQYVGNKFTFISVFLCAVCNQILYKKEDLCQVVKWHKRMCSAIQPVANKFIRNSCNSINNAGND